MVFTTTLLAGLLIGADLPRRGALGIAFSPLPSEQAAKLHLKEGEGLLAGNPVPKLTGDAAGVKAGDIILTINGRPAKVQGLAEWVRGTSAGSEIIFEVMRGSQTLKLRAPLTERPRDPGGPNYMVQYSSVNACGARMRTIITTPKMPAAYKAVLFIQGFSPVSYDYTLEGAAGDVTTLDGPILFDLANSGFVTMRVEKPGVGDSEGGPFAQLDFKSEIDIYRQAMKQLLEVPGVERKNVFIFGHSMGGSFGPIIANEFPVKGFAVYGTAGRTWFEYLMDTIRYQGLVAGQSYEGADDDARRGAQIMSLAMLENKSADEIKKLHPELASEVDAWFPGGLFNGKTLAFWRQLAQINFAQYWAKCNSHVLAVHGESDFVTYDADHKLIADIINRAHPGWGKFLKLPNSDHLFHNFATEEESMKNFQRGKFNSDFAKVMKDWIASIE